MKQRLLSSAFLLSFSFLTAAFSFGQTPQRTPEREDVVKISTNLIQVDVSVTDKKRNVVRDLTAADFEIYENGEKQTITNFRFVSADRAPAADKPRSDGSIAVPAPPSAVKPEEVRRTIALVVDDLTLSFESAYRTRRGLRKFVNEQVQEGDLVAIIRTGGGIGALQQFTTNKQQLLAAVERVRWNPSGRGGISAFAPIEPTPMEMLQANGGEVSEEDLAQERNSARSFDDFRGRKFVTGTLGALRYIVNGMGELPGRKSVILFSDGFSLVSPDEMGGINTDPVLDFLRQIIDLANRSSVVFYTVDARGLETTGLTAADKVINPTPQRLQQVLSERRDILHDTQGGLQYLAEETGGFSIINNNDLADGARQVLNDQSYYLIGYEPDSDTFDAEKRRFNKFEIKVLRSGVNARYRSGFFNVAEENLARVQPAASRLTPQQKLETAMASPFTTNGITLRLNALFANEPRSGSYIKSLLHLDANDLNFSEEADKTRKATFEILVKSFGDNGVPVDQVMRSYTVTLNEESFHRLRDEGIVYHVIFPVKKPGAYQYRVAVRDPATDRVGTASQFLEIPDLKKKGHALSSIVLDAYSTAEWERLAAADPAGALPPANSLGDTSLRKFKQDSVIRYGFEIYNPQLGPNKKPSVSTKIRVFRDGQLVLDGKMLPLEMQGQTDMARLRSIGVVSFGKGTPPGEYILQVIAYDDLAKKNRQAVTQYVQFEIVN